MTEALKATALVDSELIAYVTIKLPHLEATLPSDTYFVHDPHKSMLGYVFNAIQALFLYIRIRPKVIVTTGAGLAIPMALLGKMCGSKLILVETGARISEPSRTGKLLGGYADLVLVQWEPLLQCFPKGRYGGPLF